VEPPGRNAPTLRPGWSALAGVTVWLRWPVVAAWVVAAVAAALALPSIGQERGLALRGLVPDDAPAVAIERRSAELFDAPLLTRSVLVQRDPGGLSAAAQARLGRRAVLAGQRPAGGEHVTFALPLVNVPGLVPSSRELGTTAVTYLFTDPDLSLPAQERATERYLAGVPPRPDDAVVGVTGAAPAQLEQARAIDDALPLVEIATLAVIVLVMAATFRSPTAPLVAIAASAAAFMVAVGVVAWVGERAGLAAPGEVEPLIVVLLLGIVTDYAIFYLSAMRRQLAAGADRLAAARVAAGQVTPIVVAAGLTVAAGGAAMLAGRLDFFRALGPGLGLTALVGMAVSTTLIPAILAIAGRLVFWPDRPQRQAREADAGGRGRPGRLARASTLRAVALPVAVTCLVALATGAVILRETALGFSLVRGLPADSPPRRAAEAAAQGFAPGIVAPSELLVEAPGVTARRAELARLQGLLTEVPGVAGVVGPAALPAGVAEGALLAAGGAAARYALVLEDDPEGGRAIATLRSLERRLPELVAAAGLAGATTGLGGDTALAADTIDAIGDDVVRVGLAALVVGFVLLALFLRALVAPLYLVATSVLSAATALGLTTLVFQGLLGHDELTHYVPFAAAVLLFALGADYTIFVVGRIWDEARGRPLRDAIAVAVPGAGRALTAAGLTLALSFALLAIVPLAPFRELALAMCAGVLIETFFVRPLLVPALVAAVGRVSGWPGGRLSSPESAR
jgi:RND superfamily putative drug exporter